MKLQTAAVTLLALVILIGCSADPKQVGEKNFTQAINAYYEQNPCVVSSGLFHFPKELDSDLSFNFEGERQQLDAFVDNGFLTKIENLKKVEKRIPLSVPAKTKTVEEGTITYELTEKGKKFFRKDVVPGGLTKINGFIYGRRVVDKIEKYSEPTMLLGQKFSEIDYTYTVKDLQPWAKDIKDKNMRRMIAEDLKAAETPQKEKTALVLSANGWVHEKLFK